jgi:multiple sugar transport system substrate-binding protein
MKTLAGRFSRRQFIRASALTAGLASLVACQPKIVEVEKVVTQVVEKEVTKIVAGTPVVVTETTVVEKVITAVPVDKEPETIYVYECCWAEPHIKAGGALYRGFEQSHPDIIVDDFWPFGDPGWMEGLLAKTAADEPIDIIWWCASHHKFAEEGRLADLNPFVEGDSSGFDLADYQVTGTDFCFDMPGRQGAMWGVPTNYATILLWYNKDMFDAAGVDHPTADWTWDNALSAARELTRDTNGDGTPDEWGLLVGRDSWRTEPVVKGFGGGFVNVNGDGCLVNTPESVAGLQFLQDLMFKDKVSPGAADVAAMGSTAMFNSNKLAMLINPEWGLREHLPAHEAEGLNFGCVLLPAGPKRRVTNYWAGITSLTSRAKGSNSAWEVAKFICGDTYQRTMTVFIPESPSALIETAMYGWNDYHSYPEDRSPLIESPKYGEGYYVNERYGKEMNDIIDPALDPVWLGEAAPGDLVADICDQVNAKIAELKG